MYFLLALPLSFLKFWFFEAPKGLLLFFASVNSAFLKLFSLLLLLRTYFRPWKNEYREGLVWFSIGMGMFIKTCVITATLVLLAALLVVEITIFVLFLLWPFATIWLLL